MKRFNKTKSIYALLIAVAAMIGVTIYGSCSADEDYGDYSSRDELFTIKLHFINPLPINN